MKEYLSVVGETVSEKTIEKSRFLTYVSHAVGEEEAKAYLTKVRSLHPLATHVCYGYIADNIGTLQRFSDDGEPQGTAGMPILNVLKSQGLYECVVAVVRYFGGIKLGAGGLTRAYAGCAAEGVASAEKRKYTMCAEVSLGVDYADVNAALRFLEKEEVLSRDFGEKAVFVVAVEEERLAQFCAAVLDCFNGKADISEGKRYYYPFPN